MINDYYIHTIPLVTIVLIFLSKEIFPDDSEFVIILCILTFIVFIYYQLHESLDLMLQLRINKIEQEFYTLLGLKIKLQKQLRVYSVYLCNLENPIMNLIK